MKSECIKVESHLFSTNLSEETSPKGEKKTEIKKKGKKTCCLLPFPINVNSGGNDLWFCTGT